VIGNPQLRGFRTHRDPGTTNHPGILQFQGIPKLIIRINNRLMTVPAVTGRNVILTTAVRALLEPKTVIALLRMALLHDRFIPLRRLQQPLTTPSIVLDHTTITVGFAPEDIGKPAARA